MPIPRDMQREQAEREYDLYAIAKRDRKNQVIAMSEIGSAVEWVLAEIDRLAGIWDGYEADDSEFSKHDPMTRVEPHITF